MYVGVFLLSVVTGLLEGCFSAAPCRPVVCAPNERNGFRQNLCAVAKGEAINLLAQRLLM